MRREEESAKKKFCENAMTHNEQLEEFDLKLNSKETQTDFKTEKKSVSVQTEAPPNNEDKGIQVNFDLSEMLNESVDEEPQFESESNESVYNQSDKRVSDVESSIPEVDYDSI